MRSLLVAFAFLTVVPVRFTRPVPDATVAASRLWYPLVGLLLGGALGTAAYGLRLSPLLPSADAFLLLASWVAITGALHIDGFCDLCDGLFSGRTPADRLQIMKDPHLGTFALVGGVLLLLGKFTALTELFRLRPDCLPWLVGLAVVVPRCLVLTAAAGARYPREQGTGKVFVESVRVREGVVAAALTIGIVWPATHALGFAAVGLAGAPLLVTVVLRWTCTRRLGGMTGDCLGAGIELNELVILWTGTILLGAGGG